MRIKAVIFDWARTLYDVEKKREFSEAVNILEYCKQKQYRLALVSLVSKNESTVGTTLEVRNQQINDSNLKIYFEKIVTTENDKGVAINEAKEYFGLLNSEILIVDDRTIRGITYGNHNGYKTAWLQKGAFANELPNSETGIPTFTIKTLLELKNLI